MHEQNIPTIEDTITTLIKGTTTMFNKKKMLAIHNNSTQYWFITKLIVKLALKTLIILLSVFKIFFNYWQNKHYSYNCPKGHLKSTITNHKRVLNKQHKSCKGYGCYGIVFSSKNFPIIFSINIIIALIVEIPKPDIIPKLKQQVWILLLKKEIWIFF